MKNKVFILFDSEAWISQDGLRSRRGAAIRFFARQRNATIAIPEVVQLEVEEILTRHMINSKKNIEEGHRRLLSLLGELDKLVLPADDEIRSAVTNIIPDLDVPVRKIPLSLQACRSSMTKLMRGIPPSSEKKEQFRDGVIWAHCIELLSEGDVYLVSADSDFREKSSQGAGLAAALIEEMKEASDKHRIILKRTLEDLLDEMKEPFYICKQKVFEDVCESRSSEIENLLDSHGFVAGDNVDGSLKFFATERADMVYFSFDLSRNCYDSTDGQRDECILKISGTGFANPQTEDISELQVSNVLLRYPDWKSGDPSRGAVYLSAAFGSGPSQHRLRIPLDEPGV